MEFERLARDVDIWGYRAERFELRLVLQGVQSWVVQLSSELGIVGGYMVAPRILI
jgi:hypothetical protein